MSKESEITQDEQQRLIKKGLATLDKIIYIRKLNIAVYETLDLPLPNYSKNMCLERDLKKAIHESDHTATCKHTNELLEMQEKEFKYLTQEHVKKNFPFVNKQYLSKEGD